MLRMKIKSNKATRGMACTASSKRQEEQLNSANFKASTGRALERLDHIAMFNVSLYI